MHRKLCYIAYTSCAASVYVVVVVPNSTNTVSIAILPGWCVAATLPRRGVIPRVIDALYDRVARAGDLTQPLWTVRASYIELYREDVRDLLAPDTLPKVRPSALTW